MLQSTHREDEGAVSGANQQDESRTGRTAEISSLRRTFPEAIRGGRRLASIEEGGRRTGGGVAERLERGLVIRSVAPVAEWLRWDGRGGPWGGWRWGSPQRDGGRRRQDRRSSDGYTHRTVPAGWCRHHAPSMAQIACTPPGQEGAKVGSGRMEGVGKTFLGQVSLCLEEVRGESEGDAGSACFGQVSRRLGRLLKRLPKSRSWSDSLRILRRSSSNGSLLNASGMETH